MAASAFLTGQIGQIYSGGRNMPPATPTGRPGSVEGTVTNSVTGSPVKKATVTLRNGRFNLAFVSSSDASGHFRFDNVPPDTNYYTSIECPGYSQDQQRRAMFPQGQISVAEEQHVTGIALKLMPLGVITGKVLDENGEPVAQAMVQAMRYLFQMGSYQLRGMQTATTDDRGVYRIYDLQPAKYYIQVNRVNMGGRGGRGVRVHSHRPEETYPATFFPTGSDPGSASPTELKAGAEITSIDFRLHPVRVYHIRGTAIDAETRQPVHGTSIQLQRCTPESSVGLGFFNSSAIAPDGTFDLSNVEPGGYCLLIQQFQAKQSSFGRMPVNVSDHDVEGVTVSVAGGVQVHGSIVFDGPPPANFKPGRASLMPLDGIGRSPNTAVGADNTFVLEDVIPVRYQIQPIFMQDGYLKSIRLGDHDASDGVLDITGSCNLTLTFGTDPGKLTVTVQMPDGSAGFGTTVTVVPADALSHRSDLTYTSIVTQNGSAQFRNMAPGTYRIYAWETTDYNLMQNPEFRKLLESLSTSVTISPNGQQTAQISLIPAEKIDDAVKKMR